MVGIAQLVRAPGCGPGGHRFDSDYPPHIEYGKRRNAFFSYSDLLGCRQVVRHQTLTLAFRRFESRQPNHVGASDTKLAPIFLWKNRSKLTPLLLLLHKRSRSRRLFGCKRPHDCFGSLPTFCGLRRFESIRKGLQKSFSSSFQI